MATKITSGILTGDYNFSAKITVHNPQSGFLFRLGTTGSPSTFSPVVSFSGHSGYIFDQLGDFVWGYRSGVQVLISGSVFTVSESRMSYFIDGTLVNNNVPITAQDTDTIVFNKMGSGSLEVSFSQDNSTYNSIFFISNDEQFLAGSEGLFLIADKY